MLRPENNVDMELQPLAQQQEGYHHHQNQVFPEQVISNPDGTSINIHVEPGVEVNNNGYGTVSAFGVEKTPTATPEPGPDASSGTLSHRFVAWFQALTTVGKASFIGLTIVFTVLVILAIIVFTQIALITDFKIVPKFVKIHSLCDTSWRIDYEIHVTNPMVFDLSLDDAWAGVYPEGDEGERLVSIEATPNKESVFIYGSAKTKIKHVVHIDFNEKALQAYFQQDTVGFVHFRAVATAYVYGIPITIPIDEYIEDVRFGNLTSAFMFQEDEEESTLEFDGCSFTTGDPALYADFSETGTEYLHFGMNSTWSITQLITQVAGSSMLTDNLEGAFVLVFELPAFDLDFGNGDSGLLTVDSNDITFTITVEPARFQQLLPEDNWSENTTQEYATYASYLYAEQYIAPVYSADGSLLEPAGTDTSGPNRRRFPYNIIDAYDYRERETCVFEMENATATKGLSETMLAVTVDITWTNVSAWIMQEYLPGVQALMAGVSDVNGDEAYLDGLTLHPGSKQQHCFLNRMVNTTLWGLDIEEIRASYNGTEGTNNTTTGSSSSSSSFFSEDSAANTTGVVSNGNFTTVSYDATLWPEAPRLTVVERGTSLQIGDSAEKLTISTEFDFGLIELKGYFPGLSIDLWSCPWRNGTKFCDETVGGANSTRYSLHGFQSVEGLGRYDVLHSFNIDNRSALQDNVIAPLLQGWDEDNTDEIERDYFSHQGMAIRIYGTEWEDSILSALLEGFYFDIVTNGSFPGAFSSLQEFNIFEGQDPSVTSSSETTVVMEHELSFPGANLLAIPAIDIPLEFKFYYDASLMDRYGSRQELFQGSPSPSETFTKGDNLGYLGLDVSTGSAGLVLSELTLKVELKLNYGTSDEAFVDDETGVYYENTMSYFLSKILDEQPMYNPLVVEFALTPFKLSSYFSWHPGPDEISILPTMPPMELTQISTQSPSGGGTAALVESRVQAEFRTPYNNLPFGFTVWDASEALILSNVSLLTTETSVIPGDCSCEFEPVSLRINLETTAILRFVCNCSCFPTGGGTTCESLPLTEADLFVASDATDATGCTALVSALCDTDTETWYADTGAEILTGSCMNATQTDQVFVAPCTVDTDVQLESALPAVRYINAAAEVDRHGYQIVAGVHDFRVPLILYTN